MRRGTSCVGATSGQTCTQIRFFHCRISQGQFNRRHDHIRDALHDMTGASVRDDTPYNISVTREPLVRLLSIPDPLASASYPPHDLDAIMGIAAAVDNAEDTHYIEDIPRLYCARTTLADRRARGTEDKTVGQCRGDLGVSVDSPTTFLDLVVADTTARFYRRPPPLCPPPACGHHTRGAAAPGEYLGASSTHGLPPRRRGCRWQASRQDIP